VGKGFLIDTNAVIDFVAGRLPEVTTIFWITSVRVKGKHGFSGMGMPHWPGRPVDRKS